MEDKFTFLEEYYGFMTKVRKIIETGKMPEIFFSYKKEKRATVGYFILALLCIAFSINAKTNINMKNTFFSKLFLTFGIIFFAFAIFCLIGIKIYKNNYKKFLKNFQNPNGTLTITKKEICDECGDIKVTIKNEELKGCYVKKTLFFVLTKTKVLYFPIEIFDEFKKGLEKEKIDLNIQYLK